LKKRRRFERNAKPVVKASVTLQMLSRRHSANMSHVLDTRLRAARGRAGSIKLSLPATSIAPSAFDGREVRIMSPFGKKTRPARRRTNQPAWMTVDGGFATRQCIVIDISEGGARLRVDDPQFVKPQFQLKFDRTSPGRACKVAWKKGDVVGIKFV
jgi:hypothetical protein